MAIALVRPNLGNPLIVTPDKLKRFQITIAGKGIDVPLRQAIHSGLNHNPPEITCKNRAFPLTIHHIGSVYRHPEFTHDYSSGKFADSASKNQYVRGYIAILNELSCRFRHP